MAMFDLATLLLFALAALALIAVPGPNMIYIVTRGISQGRGAAVASVLGVGTGTLAHIGAAAAGLSALLVSSTLAFDVVKYLGAAYLLYLGIRTIRGEGDARIEHARGHDPLWRIYRQGVVVNLLNPKTALFFLAFLPQFVDPARGGVAAQILVLGTILLLLGGAMDLLYALIAGALGGWLRRRPAFLRRQRYVTGSVYLLLGAAAAITGSGRHRA